MRKYRSYDWVRMVRPVTVVVAAGLLGWSELMVWKQIRQRKVRWGIRWGKVVVDMNDLS